ncbi:MAG: lipid-A-disaccharide synthase [Cytophagales bacterium]|nr:lipid-A-disaccharide synthase [Cytophagales bacterium]
MKYFLIAGERSGDLHGAFLIKQLLNLQPEAELRGYGGDQMAEQGMDLVAHYREISFMGFIEVVQNLQGISRRLKECEREILRFRPNVLILIDFPGFNLRMARFANSHQFKVAYYIAPKAWAWKESRANSIKKYVNRLYSILPFEVDFFQRHDCPVHYVGNPVVEEIKQHVFTDLSINHFTDTKIAYLPGSRVQEVQTSIKMIIECARLRPDWHFLIAAVDNVDEIHYKPLEGLVNVQVFLGKTYEVLRASDAAIVTSGTATLETALLNIPQVVCYRTSKISYWIARAVIKVRFISLVNLILDDRVVQEFVQHEYTPEIVLKEVERIFEKDGYRQRMLNNYKKLNHQIGSYSASQKVAEDITAWMKESD